MVLTTQLNIPEALRARIEQAASQRGTSVNALAIKVLEEQFPPDDPTRHQSIHEILAEWRKEDAAMSDEESEANLEVMRCIDESRSSYRKLFQKYLSPQEPS